MPTDSQPPSDPPVRSTECYAALWEALNQIAYLTRPGTRNNLMHPGRAFKEREEAYEWVQEAKRAAKGLRHNND